MTEIERLQAEVERLRSAVTYCAGKYGAILRPDGTYLWPDLWSGPREQRGGSSLAVEAAETLRELGRENARLRAVERAAREIVAHADRVHNAVRSKILATAQTEEEAERLGAYAKHPQIEALRHALSTVVPAPSAGDQGAPELTPEWTANVLSRPNALLDYVRRTAPASTEDAVPRSMFDPGRKSYNAKIVGVDPAPASTEGREWIGCYDCNGSGVTGPHLATCPACHGTGGTGKAGGR